MSYNKNTNWDNEEKYLNNLIKTGNAGEKAWAQKQLGTLSKAKAQYGNTDSITLLPSPSNPYNANTNWANEEAYLTGLSQNGNAGEQAWANNQMTLLSGAKTQYGATPTATPLSYTPTGTYNDAGLPAEALAEIQAYREAFEAARAKGDTKAMEMAHAGAEAVRAKYGYSGGTDGSDYIQIDYAPANTGGGLTANDILTWNDNYNAENTQPTYTEPTVAGKPYSEEIENILKEILTREDFSYDVESDPLYAQYKTMYNREGDRAMRDTLADLAISAGGMNSYAVSAAQQANNYYNSQLNDKIPELYQLAYEMYLQDKESKVQDLGILTQMDETQYNRYRDTMSDWRADKDFAYGAYTDAVTQGNWEKSFDYNQSVADRDYEFKDYWTNKEWTASEQATAKDEVWKLISIGVTPSADLVAKAGMNQTDIDLAVAAVKAGTTVNTGSSGSSSGGSGNKGGSTGSSGSSGGSGNTSYTGTTATSGITDEIKNKCAGFRSNNALANYLDGLESSGVLTPEESNTLYAQYVDDNEKYIANEDGTYSDTHSYRDMMNSTQGWEVIDDGGINWFWGLDGNAVLEAPNGEQITIDNLLKKLVSEGMSENDAEDAIKALQENLQI